MARALAILDQFGNPIRPARGPRSYLEAAETTRLNSRHWDRARTADANAAVLPWLEETRNRAKYELHNSSYARGVVNSYCDDLIGRDGPRLHVSVTGRDRKGFAARVEDGWADWCEHADASSGAHFVDVLKMDAGALFWAGDYVRQFINAPDAPPDTVSLRVLPIAPERLATPYGMVGRADVLGGVRLGANGRPAGYFVLKTHPGAMYAWANYGEFVELPADSVQLVFVRTEPGQVRGEPWLAPSIELFAQYRRYMSDTMAAARVAALMAGFLQTSHPGATFEDMPAGGATIFDLEPGTVTPLPAGWQFTQSQPAHPGANFRDFKREILSEIGRPVAMPWLRISCDASGHTYSSARLDLNSYETGIDGCRGWLERVDLNPLFRRWFAEWRLVTAAKLPRDWSYRWGWPAPRSIDPSRDVSAAAGRLAAGLSTYRDECGANNGDWLELFEQQAVERAERTRLGLPDPQLTARTARAQSPAVSGAAQNADAADAGGDNAGQADREAPDAANE